MNIRQKQVGEFEHVATASFEDRMLVHLHKCFPGKCEGQKESELREVVRNGIEKASRYEIHAERDVCHYIDLMMVFGNHFDRDEKLPWASRILNEKLYRNGTARMERLYSEAKEHE